MMRLLLAAVMLLAPLPSHAQIVRGTDPSVPSVVTYMGSFGNGYSQSFVADGTQLSRLTFWYYPGAAPAGFPYGWFSTLTVFSRTGYHDFAFWQGSGEGVLFGMALDHNTSGRFDIVFPTPLQLVLGDTYAFGVYSNNCSPYEVFAECYVPEGSFALPHIEMTANNAYDRGQAFQLSEGPNGRDLRFEVVFLPEPSTAALCAVALLALAVRPLRRRAAALHR